MTIGIGVLGSAIAKCDTLVLVSDTMGSIGDAYSTPLLSKTFIYPDEGLYIVAADQIEKAAELVGMIRAALQNLPDRTHGSIQGALHNAVDNYRRRRFMQEVLPRYNLGPQDWPSAKKHIRDTVAELFTWFDINCELLVGTFDDCGRALLYYIPGVAGEPGGAAMSMVRVEAYPGAFAIGTGSDNARFWLCYRNHQLTLAPKRAAYHAYEAKLMAESSPHVNEKIEMVIATPDGHVHLRDSQPERGAWSLTEFREMYRKYGPQNTEELDVIEESPDPQPPTADPSVQPPSREASGETDES